jgi:hypothetical protein
MNYIITKHQLKIIAEGATGSKFGENMRRLYSFSTRLISKVEKKYGLNLKLLSTWGPAVGGFVMPLDNFIKSGSFNFTEQQSALILVGVAATIFFDNKPILKKVYDKIKEEGLVDGFKQVLGRAKELKKTFIKFIQSLSTSITSISEIISYSFLIPIVSDIQNMLGKNSDLTKLSELITERLFASGVVVVGAVLLTEIIDKMIKRLSQ